MQFVCASIEINAPASVVWAVLQRFAPNGRWRAPGADSRTSAADLIALGMRALDCERADDNPSPVAGNRPLEVHSRRRYLGPGLYTTERGFRIERLASGGVRLHQSEKIRGLFSGFFSRGERRATEEDFHVTNYALKTCAERVHAGLPGAPQPGA